MEEQFNKPKTLQLNKLLLKMFQNSNSTSAKKKQNKSHQLTRKLVVTSNSNVLTLGKNINNSDPQALRSSHKKASFTTPKSLSFEVGIEIKNHKSVTFGKLSNMFTRRSRSQTDSSQFVNDSIATKNNTKTKTKNKNKSKDKSDLIDQVLSISQARETLSQSATNANSMLSGNNTNINSIDTSVNEANTANMSLRDYSAVVNGICAKTKGEKAKEKDGKGINTNYVTRTARMFKGKDNDCEITFDSLSSDGGGFNNNNNNHNNRNNFVENSITVENKRYLYINAIDELKIQVPKIIGLPPPKQPAPLPPPLPPQPFLEPKLGKVGQLEVPKKLQQGKGQRSGKDKTTTATTKAAPAAPVVTAVEKHKGTKEGGVVVVETECKAKATAKAEEETKQGSIESKSKNDSKIQNDKNKKRLSTTLSLQLELLSIKMNKINNKIQQNKEKQEQEQENDNENDNDSNDDVDEELKKLISKYGISANSTFKEPVLSIYSVKTIDYIRCHDPIIPCPSPDLGLGLKIRNGLSFTSVTTTATNTTGTNVSNMDNNNGNGNNNNFGGFYDNVRGINPSITPIQGAPNNISDYEWHRRFLNLPQNGNDTRLHDNCNSRNRNNNVSISISKVSGSNNNGNTNGNGRLGKEKLKLTCVTSNTMTSINTVNTANNTMTTMTTSGYNRLLLPPMANSNHRLRVNTNGNGNGNRNNGNNNANGNGASPSGDDNNGKRVEYRGRVKFTRFKENSADRTLFDSGARSIIETDISETTQFGTDKSETIGNGNGHYDRNRRDKILDDEDGQDPSLSSLSGENILKNEIINNLMNKNKNKHKNDKNEKNINVINGEKDKSVNITNMNAYDYYLQNMESRKVVFDNIGEREEGSYDSDNYNSSGSDADNEDEEEDEDDSECNSMEIFDDQIQNANNFDNNFTDCGYYDYKYGSD